MKSFKISFMEMKDVEKSAKVLSIAMLDNPLHHAVFQNTSEETRILIENDFEKLLKNIPGIVFIAKANQEIVGVMRMNSCSGKNKKRQKVAKDENSIGWRKFVWLNEWDNQAMSWPSTRKPPPSMKSLARVALWLFWIVIVDEVKRISAVIFILWVQGHSSVLNASIAALSSAWLDTDVSSIQIRLPHAAGFAWAVSAATNRAKTAKTSRNILGLGIAIRALSFFMITLSCYSLIV
jgi:hypothetical protein